MIELRWLWVRDNDSQIDRPSFIGDGEGASSPVVDDYPSFLLEYDPLMLALGLRGLDEALGSCGGEVRF